MATDAPAPSEPEVGVQAQIEDVMTRAPFITRQAARALLEGARGRGVGLGDPLDAALFAASSGFKGMDRITLDELSALVAQALEAHPADERRQIQEYLDYARVGGSLSADRADAGRTLFAEGVRSLPSPSRHRLAKLFGMAVVVGLHRREEAEERARLAALTPIPLPESSALGGEGGSPVPGTGGSSVSARTNPRRRNTGTDQEERRPSTRGEAYWRSRAASARAAIDQAKSRVRELEERARRLGPYTPGPKLPACQEGAGGYASGGVVAFRDSTVGARSCNSEVMRTDEARTANAQLEAAREALNAREKSLRSLQEEARRAGALPGWLR